MAGLGGLDALRSAIVRLGSTAIPPITSDAKAARRASGFRSAQEVLEVAVFGEDVSKRLVHNLVRRSVQESGVLVDLPGGRLVETDHGGYIVGLNDLKQRHNEPPS